MKRRQWQRQRQVEKDWLRQLWSLVWTLCLLVKGSKGQFIEIWKRQNNRDATMSGSDVPRNLSELEKTVASHRLVHGSPVGPNSIPFFAHLLVQNEQNELSYNTVCGGALIAPQWVLTATHCLVDEDASENQATPVVKSNLWGWQVGYYCTSNDNCGQSYRLVPARRFFVPQSYQTALFLQQDVALVQLQQAVLDIAHALPDDGSVWEQLQAGVDPLTPVARGMTAEGSLASRLEFLDMVLLSTSECGAHWHAWRDAFESQRAFCLSSRHGNVCLGDSGSPVISRFVLGPPSSAASDFSFHVVGVVSGGEVRSTTTTDTGTSATTCAGATLPGIFGSVSAVYPWISDLICAQDSEAPLPSWCPPSSSTTTCLESTTMESAQQFQFANKRGKIKHRTCQWLQKSKPKRRRIYCCSNDTSTAAMDCPSTCCPSFPCA